MIKGLIGSFLQRGTVGSAKQKPADQIVQPLKQRSNSLVYEDEKLHPTAINPPT